MNLEMEVLDQLENPMTAAQGWLAVGIAFGVGVGLGAGAAIIILT